MRCWTGVKRRIWLGAVLLSAAGFFSGCTSMAKVSKEDRLTLRQQGPPIALRLTIFKDYAVSAERAAAIVEALRKEFSPYGLDIQVAALLEWKRPSFSHQGIIRDIARRPLRADADRSLALVGRDIRDFMWGTLLPEALGAVEIRTHTKGYVVAEMGSLNQLLTFQTPVDAAVHEFYHMLGCDHHDAGQTIATKIARLKRSAIHNRLMGRNFFPGISRKGEILLTRRDVDAHFGLAQAHPPKGDLAAATP